MKAILIIVLFSSMSFSCGRNRESLALNGRWLQEISKGGCEIVFDDGVYDQTKWNDDLINKSYGKYFLNSNKNRSGFTVTLVPDAQYSEGDTIILPCENIDIITLTDSVIISRRPTQWVRRNNMWVKTRETIKYKRQKSESI